ncbi:hypothetical protein H5410_045970, partial [Solanum commersonii]
MRTPTEESQMMRILDGSLVEFKGRLSEINSRPTKVEDEIWAKETGFTLPSYVMDELRDKRKKKEGHVESEAQGEGEKRKLKGKVKLLLAEHKEIREDIGVESALILKDHELQANPSHSSLPYYISLFLQDP